MCRCAGKHAHSRLWPSHVSFAEEELPVEVGDIDGVEVDDVDISKARERQVLEQLAAKATSTHYKHACHLTDKGEHLRHRLKGYGRLEDRAKVSLVGERTRAREKLGDIAKARVIVDLFHAPALLAPPPRALQLCVAPPPLHFTSKDRPVNRPQRQTQDRENLWLCSQSYLHRPSTISLLPHVVRMYACSV